MKNPGSHPSDFGFSTQPAFLVSPAEGLEVYRCWGFRDAGVGSGETGTGFFSLVKPSSVHDAEVRLNLLAYDDEPRFGTNGIHRVSTFWLLPGFAYWKGSIAGGIGEQVFVEAPLDVKLSLVESEALRHDYVVGPRDGTA